MSPASTQPNVMLYIKCAFKVQAVSCSNNFNQAKEYIDTGSVSSKGSCRSNVYISGKTTQTTLFADQSSFDSSLTSIQVPDHKATTTLSPIESKLNSRLMASQRVSMTLEGRGRNVNEWTHTILRHLAQRFGLIQNSAPLKGGTLP